MSTRKPSGTSSRRPLPSHPPAKGPSLPTEECHARVAVVPVTPGTGGVPSEGHAGALPVAGGEVARDAEVLLWAGGVDDGGARPADPGPTVPRTGRWGRTTEDGPGDRRGVETKGSKWQSLRSSSPRVPPSAPVVFPVRTPPGERRHYRLYEVRKKNKRCLCVHGVLEYGSHPGLRQRVDLSPKTHVHQGPDRPPPRSQLRRCPTLLPPEGSRMWADLFPKTPFRVGIRGRGEGLRDWAQSVLQGPRTLLDGQSSFVARLGRRGGGGGDSESGVVN